MKKKTVIIVVGARPQFIKILPMVRHLKKKFILRIVNTGQHYDYMMSQIFFRELNIPKPDVDLGIGSGPQASQTADMIKSLEKVFLGGKVDMVILVGDTNSTLAGAIAAVKSGIPVAHVESGLRSYRKSMPEEVNRVVTDHVSALLFCPTRNAVINLKKEGISKGVFMSGDVMKESLESVLERVKENRKILSDLDMPEKGYYLLTIHRDFNTDDQKGMESLFRKILSSGKKIVFPVHPRTEKALKNFGIWEKLKKNKSLLMTFPVGYVDFLSLMYFSKLLLTDSGGAQKEAYMLKVPCVTLRDETEWIETLEGGANRLGGRYGLKLKSIPDPTKMKCFWKRNLYGNTSASVSIVKTIREFLS